MAAIRSFVKIQPITGKSGIAQNMDQVRKSINRMGAVTDGIAKSFYDTTELLKFEKEYLSDTSKEEVTDIKKKDKKEKTKWTDSMRKFRRSFAKKKREKLEDQAEKGVEEGKEEGRKKVEKEKPKMSMLGRFLNGIATVFKYLIIFGALNWLSNPQNAERAVKVFKVLFAIGKFAFNVAKKIIGSKASSSQIPMMGSEDFSYFLKKVPGCFAWIGNGASASLHNPKYDFNDSILTVGSSFLASIAEDRLSIDQLQHQLVQEDGTGFLLETSDLVLKNYDYLVLESHVDVNLATQTRDYADNATYEADAGFGTASTADDILDFTERNPFGEEIGRAHV